MSRSLASGSAPGVAGSAFKRIPCCLSQWCLGEVIMLYSQGVYRAARAPRQDKCDITVSCLDLSAAPRVLGKEAVSQNEAGTAERFRHEV